MGGVGIAEQPMRIEIKRLAKHAFDGFTAILAIDEKATTKRGGPP